MTKYLLKLQYLGLKYCGSQKQSKHLEPKQKTIQEELENALSTLTRRNISTIFSGRTDSGVSAYSQCVHFVYKENIDNFDKFLYSLNSLLPNDIVVFEISNVDDNFHAQMSAKYRHYQYKIRSAKVKSPFDLNVYYTRQKLDVEALNEMLSFIIGEHDFSAFKSTSNNPAKICKIFEAYALKNGDYIEINIIGNRFLYNMVRTIVGTMLMIEKKSYKPAYMKEILSSKERSNAGQTIDAIGLTLVEVGYDTKYETYEHRKANK